MLIVKCVYVSVICICICICNIDFTYNVAIYADNTTLYSKCDQASDLWQQLELTFKYESDLWDTVDWGRKLVINSIAGKTQLVWPFY